MKSLFSVSTHYSPPLLGSTSCSEFDVIRVGIGSSLPLFFTLKVSDCVVICIFALGRLTHLQVNLIFSFLLSLSYDYMECRQSISNILGNLRLVWQWPENTLHSVCSIEVLEGEQASSPQLNNAWHSQHMYMDYIHFSIRQQDFTCT